MCRLPARARVPLPPGLHVRDARPEDAPALHALYHAAYAPGQDPHRPPTMGLKDTVDDVRAYIEEGGVLVAEDEQGRLVATVMLRSMANVRRLAVAPERAGSGLGAAMLEAGLERAKTDGFAWAFLDTMPEHPWLPKFYASRGFEERSVETLTDGTKWLVFRKRLL